jgi:HSP20 family molecular chaperone IbpA
MRKNIFDIFDYFDDNFFPSFYNTKSLRREVFSIPTLPTFKKDGQNLTLSLEVPGYGPEDVDVEVKDGNLLVSYGKNSFSTTLPKEGLVDELTATVKHGVLTVSIPAKETKQLETKKIKVLG